MNVFGANTEHYVLAYKTPQCVGFAAGHIHAEHPGIDDELAI